jgi:RNA polymerase sigma-70 factor, ECF subfamily
MRRGGRLLKPGWTGSPESEADSDLRDGGLLDVIGAAQHAYPAVHLPFDAFVAYLRDRLPAQVPLALALRQVHAADLYLACACARGDVRAFAAFDDRCMRPLDGVLRKMGIAADVIADVKQEIRNLVLIGDGKAPKIIEFAGRGDLRSWVRVMAVRWALQRQSRARREQPVDDDRLLDRLVGSSNPELDHAKGLYRREFKRAFDEALRTLPARDLVLLRQHHVDGLTIDELAALYRVHRSTAARLLARARLRMFEATRAHMMAQLRVQPHEFDSILRMIRSNIEISLCGALRRRKR